MSNEQQAFYAACRGDFETFFRAMYSVASSGGELVDAPYISLLCDCFMRVVRGEIENLIINVPPRHLKSFIFSVCGPAWLLGISPSTKIMAVSHDQRLAEDLHAKFRKLVESDRYRAIFPGFGISAAANTKDNLETLEGGGRRAVSVESSPTGLGADMILLDDPLNPEDACNPDMCRRHMEQLTRSILSRKNRPGAPVILIQQRLSLSDTTKAFEGVQGWTKIALPLVATEDEEFALTTGQVFRRFQGELLSPNRVRPQDVERLRQELGPNFEAQHQQNPVAARGTLISDGDLPVINSHPGGLDYTVSIDTAPNGVAGTSRTAMLVIGRDRRNNYVVHATAKKLEFPEILELAKRLSEHYGAHRVLVEDEGLGHSVIELLRSQGLAVLPCKPRGQSKVQRLQAVIGRFKASEVIVLDRQPWTADFREELLQFPYGGADDQVDALTQYLSWVEQTTPSGHPPVVVGVSSGLTAHVRRMSPFTREAGLERQVPRGFRGGRGR
ncbi:MAG: hypothetical protein ABS35_27005 [Kaistia sp. SCN 65-12]|nr:MAG: hypothetical protein ABS35_27005 [Kaistia sp. SCN 65-12]